VAAAAALTFAAGAALAQNLPPSPGQIPQIRRGADGHIEIVPPKPAPTPTPAPLPPPAAGSPLAAPAPQPAPSGQAATPPAPAAAAAASPEAKPAPAVPPAATPVSAEISLPDLLAVELPPGVAQLAPTDAPLRELLDQAKSGHRHVTNDLAQPVGPGPHRVTWTAWAGVPGSSAADATRSATLFVLPHGFTSVGLSGDDHATAGNNAMKIARDGAGRVHMVWLDAGRTGGGTRVMYRRATTDAAGGVQWETAPLRVDDSRSEAWNAYAGLALSHDKVHFVWQAGGKAWYRALTHHGSVRSWGPARDIGAASEAEDLGPSIAVAHGVIHVVTPSGIYAFSNDQGETWHAAPIPAPEGETIQGPTVALDSLGDAHIAFIGKVRGPMNASKEAASRGYWELRYVRRTADDRWVDPQNVLSGDPAWAEPKGQDDVLAAWVQLRIDEADSLHVVWHGTAATRIYGNDEAYYSWRRAAGPGSWEARWAKPQPLVPMQPKDGISFSFAPSLALDGETVLATAFYDINDGGRWRGLDALARVIRRGVFDEATIAVSPLVRASIEANRPDAALSAIFVVTAPRLFHAPDGRVWLDVIETLVPLAVDGAPRLVVYRPVEVTRALDAKLTLGDILFYLPKLGSELWRSMPLPR
jgi:hypothetical protein